MTWQLSIRIETAERGKQLNNLVELTSSCVSPTLQSGKEIQQIVTISKGGS